VSCIDRPMLHHRLAAGNNTGHTITLCIYRPQAPTGRRAIFQSEPSAKLLQRRGVVAPVGPLLLVVRIRIQMVLPPAMQIKSGIKSGGTTAAI